MSPSIYFLLLRSDKVNFYLFFGRQWDDGIKCSYVDAHSELITLQFPQQGVDVGMWLAWAQLYNNVHRKSVAYGFWADKA